jgi:hypothetical protein
MVTIYALDMNISCSNFEGSCDATPAVLQILVTVAGVAVALAKEIFSIAPIMALQLSQAFATKIPGIGANLGGLLGVTPDHYTIQPLVELCEGCMVALKVL